MVFHLTVHETLFLFFWLLAVSYLVASCFLDTHMPKEHPEYHVPKSPFLLQTEKAAWKLEPDTICKSSVHLTAQGSVSLCHLELIEHSAFIPTTAVWPVGSYHPPTILPSLSYIINFFLFTHTSSVYQHVLINSVLKTSPLDFTSLTINFPIPLLSLQDSFKEPPH